MARPKHLYVFSYDVARDNDRARLAALLQATMTRVQKSVFEGRLTPESCRKLADKAALLLGQADSLRIYCLTEETRAMCEVFGDPPLSEAEDFWLI
jgi:CRISPR-associated endonuclease Cas2